MSNDWRTVCDPPTAIGVVGVTPTAYCSPAAVESSSPIDAYYQFAEELLKVATPTALQDSPALGRLLVLGLVSSVETYLRAVLASVLRCCPQCRAHAAEIPIPLGALDYYSEEDVEYGLLDRSSLASEKEVRSWTKKLWGMDLTDSDLSGTVSEYDKLCHVRHASVHAQGRLGSANARSLGLPPDSGLHGIEVSYAGLQDAGALCHSFVRSFNSWAWRKHVERWHATQVFVGVWSEDKKRFGDLAAIFHSETDRGGPPDLRELYRALPFGYRMRR